MNIKLFTHNDLDGIGCYILAQLTFINVDVEYCSYSDVNVKVKDFLDNKEYKKYDHVFITDISVSEEIADIIDKSKSDKFSLIDHHNSELHLNKHKWCKVVSENEKGKTSGTSLFYNILLDEDIENSKSLEQFVELVRQYDSWEWKTKYNNQLPNQVNNLLGIYTRELFIDRLMGKLKEEEFKLDSTDLMLLDLEENKKNIYFEKKAKDIIFGDVKGYKVGIVFAEQFISELGNYLAEQFSNLDFIVIINDKKVSYRTIREDIDLGVIAKKFCGGGHPKAAGSQIDISKQLQYINNIFK